MEWFLDYCRNGAMRSLFHIAEVILSIEFTLNGSPVSVKSDLVRPLLDVLRDELGLKGAKQGCDHEGECGACTVLLDGQPVRSCLTPVGSIAERHVLTIEGLGEPEHLHPLQSAFIEVGAVQCGFCTPGMILAAKSLLDDEPSPDREQIIEALDGNLCRCTGYTKIITAVELAGACLRGELQHEHNFSSDIAPIGGSVLREDSVGKVIGETQYAEDIEMDGLLHIKTVRSPHHHAVLRALNVSTAEQMPGVRRVLTAVDVPGVNGFPEYSIDEPVLVPVGDTVRMLGAPVALVIAESVVQALAAVEAVDAQYDLLPHTFDLEDALQPDAYPIGKHGNILSTYEIRHGDLDAGIAATNHQIDVTYETAYLEHTALERETLVGYISVTGQLTIVGGVHNPHRQQRYIADLLRVVVEQVRVVVPPTGGSFGGKQDSWPFMAMALAVYHVRQPVRMVFSRAESFEVSPKRHPFQMNYQISATREGVLNGVRMRLDCNTGGYDSSGSAMPNFALTASVGAYKWQTIDGVARSVYTNGPKSGQYRGFGTTQPTFALECALDELAENMGIDPVDLRMMNCLGSLDQSYLGFPITEPLGYHEVLQAVQPYFDQFQQEVDTFNSAQPSGILRRGVGMAGMWYRFGKTGDLKVETHAELASDGHFIVYCSAPDYGQGSNTTMSQIAADAFGVEREQIEIVNADTAFVPDSDVPGASRQTFFVGNSIRQTAGTLLKEILGVAAEMLDDHPANLITSSEQVNIRNSPARSVALTEVAQEFDRIGKSRRVADFFDLSPVFPVRSFIEYIPLFVTGAHAVDISVNMETGVVKVLRVAAVHDVGRLVNRPDAEGQIEGAVVMGIGAALQEEYLPGQTRSIGEYYIPTIGSIPKINSILLEVPGQLSSLGVKGLGETAMLPITPAIINAISRVIGVRLRSIPATPDRVLAAIKKNQPGETLIKDQGDIFHSPPIVKHHQHGKYPS
jgi:aldehyde oxidoreductase